MNLEYIKNFLKTRRDNITPKDVDDLIHEIDVYRGSEDNFANISKVMKVINEYNLTFITKVQEYEVLPKDDIKQLPQRLERVREILCTLSMLHTYLVLSVEKISNSSFDTSKIKKYLVDLKEKKEHFKSEKMTWGIMLKSLVQEASFTTEMRKLDIEDQMGYLKYKDN